MPRGLGNTRLPRFAACGTRCGTPRLGHAVGRAGALEFTTPVEPARSTFLAGAEQGAPTGHGLGLAIFGGARRGARRTHPGQEPRPRPRPRRHVHLEPAGGWARPARRRPIARPSRRLPRNPASRRASWWWTTTPWALRFVRDALSEAGYAPLVTGAAHDLPRIIRTEKPRLVLLDLMPPDTDGIELMGQVPELADVPVIFISGYGRDETVAKALESGRPTTSSSPSRRPSWSPGSGQRCGAARSPSRSWSATSPSTTRTAE